MWLAPLLPLSAARNALNDEWHVASAGEICKFCSSARDFRMIPVFVGRTKMAVVRTQSVHCVLIPSPGASWPPELPCLRPGASACSKSAATKTLLGSTAPRALRGSDILGVGPRSAPPGSGPVLAKGGHGSHSRRPQQMVPSSFAVPLPASPPKTGMLRL